MIEKIFPALGTVNMLCVYDADEIDTAEQIRKRVLELHHRFSFFEPHSDVSRINASAGVRPVLVHPDTLRILALALEYEELTRGAFSVMSGPSARLWKDAIRASRIPDEFEIERCRKLGTSGRLVLDVGDGTAFLPQQGQQIDLGGIAKGFAADEAARILQEAEVSNTLINFGGTIITTGRKQRIGIQNPFEKRAGPIADICVKNSAVVTSGLYEQAFSIGGRRYHHIVDPRTGRPSESGVVSVTLIGKSATELDALATAACVLGKDASRRLLKKRHIKGLYIREDGDSAVTSRLHGFHMRKDIVKKGGLSYV